jgi:hypothetical protein
MSDDDWEKECDDVLEDKKEVAKDNKFEDEDNYDSDEEKKKKDEEAKKAKENAAPARKKDKGKDYEKMFEDRTKTTKKGPAKPGMTQESGKSKGAKDEAFAVAAEEDITDQLFASDI